MAFQVNTTKQPMQSKRERYEWPMIDEMAYQLVFVGSKNKVEKAYDDRNKRDDDPSVVWVPRVEFSFVLLRPGAHEAMVEIEAMDDTPERAAKLAAWDKKYKAKSHGRMFWLTVNEPQYLALPGETKKLSNLYSLVLKGLLNNGLDLTKEHVANLVPLINELEGKDADGNETDELKAGTFVRPQFMCYITADPSKGKNTLKKVNKRVDEDEMLPDYRPFNQLVDKRWASEDPSVVCVETGEQIHGYELKYGEDKGKWVTQAEAAKRSVELYGAVYAPSVIRRLKAEKEAAGGEQATASAAAPAGKGKKDEKLPF